MATETAQFVIDKRGISSLTIAGPSGKKYTFSGDKKITVSDEVDIKWFRSHKSGYKVVKEVVDGKVELDQGAVPMSYRQISVPDNRSTITSRLLNLKKTNNLPKIPTNITVNGEPVPQDKVGPQIVSSEVKGLPIKNTSGTLTSELLNEQQEAVALRKEMLKNKSVDTQREVDNETEENADEQDESITQDVKFDSKAGGYRCPKCGKLCNSNNGLNIHMQRMHKDDEAIINEDKDSDN